MKILEGKKICALDDSGNWRNGVIESRLSIQFTVRFKDGGILFLFYKNSGSRIRPKRKSKR